MSDYSVRVRGLWALPLAAVTVAAHVVALAWRVEVSRSRTEHPSEKAHRPID